MVGRITWPWSYRPKAKSAVETTPGGAEATPWVVIAVNLTPMEAVIIKGRLDSEGLPAWVQQEAVGTMLGLTVGPLGSVKILVPEALAAQSIALLADTFETDEVDDE